MYTVGLDVDKYIVFTLNFAICWKTCYSSPILKKYGTIYIIWIQKCVLCIAIKCLSAGNFFFSTKATAVTKYTFYLSNNFLHKIKVNDFMKHTLLLSINFIFLVFLLYKLLVIFVYKLSTFEYYLLFYSKVILTKYMIIYLLKLLKRLYTATKKVTFYMCIVKNKYLLMLEWDLHNSPKPHRFFSLQLQSSSPGSNKGDDPKLPYEGKGKGKATEEDMRRMFPEEFYKEDNNNNDTKKVQEEYDYELAKDYQERLNLEWEINNFKAKSKKLAAEHNETRILFDKEKNMEKKIELSKKLDNDKEEYQNAKSDAEELKNLFRTRYNAEPNSETESETWSESDGSEPDSVSDEEDSDEEGRLSKKPKTSHDSKNDNNILPLVSPFKQSPFKNLSAIIRPFYSNLSNFSFVLFTISIIFPGFDLIQFVNELLKLFGDFSDNVKQQIAVFLFYHSFWKKTNKFIKLGKIIIGFINNTRNPIIWSFLLMIVTAFGLFFYFSFTLSDFCNLLKDWIVYIHSINELNGAFLESYDTICYCLFAILLSVLFKWSSSFKVFIVSTSNYISQNIVKLISWMTWLLVLLLVVLFSLKLIYWMHEVTCCALSVLKEYLLIYSYSSYLNSVIDIIKFNSLVPKSDLPESSDPYTRIEIIKFSFLLPGSDLSKSSNQISQIDSIKYNSLIPELDLVKPSLMIHNQEITTEIVINSVSVILRFYPRPRVRFDAGAGGVTERHTTFDFYEKYWFLCESSIVSLSFKKLVNFYLLHLSIHKYKHKSINNDEDLGYFLSGLMEGAGLFYSRECQINLKKKDSALGYFLRRKIGYGKIFNRFGKQISYGCTKKKGLSRILSLTNDKLIKKITSYNTFSRLIQKNELDKVIISVDNFTDIHSKYMLKSLSYKPFNLTLNNFWLSGFTQACGWLYVGVEKSKKHLIGYRPKLELNFQHENKEYLEMICGKMKMGKVYNNKLNEWYYKSLSFKLAGNIINYFDKYNLLFEKYVQYVKYRKVYLIVISNDHNNKKGIYKIKSISKKGSSETSMQEV